MADKSFGVLIIGAGPGGYVTAIRAAQHHRALLQQAQKRETPRYPL